MPCRASRLPLAIILLLLAGGSAQPTTAQPATAPPVGAANADFFDAHVAPLLQAKCGKCHGEETRKAELDLTSAAGIRRGSESGEIVAAGEPGESLLFQMADGGGMPPEGEPQLTPEELETLRGWLADGAAMPADNQPAHGVTQHDAIPVLLLRCTVCHGARRQEAGLDLRTKESMLRGGKSGPAIVPGDAEASLLIQKIHSGEMPPLRRVVEVSIKPIEPHETALLAEWIAAGAPEVSPHQLAPDAGDGLVSDEDRQFWSFRPPQAAEPPAVRDAARVRNPIDAFLLAKLDAAGLTFSPEADRRTLLRRASFDLTGLPPTPAETAAFLADEGQQAYELMVDRLLASPRYGERWGRYWLDLAGYSDSEGVQNSDPVRPFAWRYRDYVIRALNADKPYDRFLLEQIAGDELADYENAAEITPEIADNLIATGFLRMAADGSFSAITAFVPDRLDTINAELEVLSSSVLGLTMRCARCHSHKFDPIPQRDYYRLAAVFKGALDEHDWLKPNAGGAGTLGGFDTRYLPQVTTAERTAWDAHESEISRQVAEMQATLESLAAETILRLREERLTALPEPLREDLRGMLAAPVEGRSEVQRYLAEKFEAELTIAREGLEGLDAAFKQAAAETAARVNELNGQRRPQPLISALWDRGEPSPTYVLRRGNYLTPGDPVEPGAPTVLSEGPLEIAPPWPGAKQTGRRLAFARWLTRADHPLTARVLVNRVWHHHFGRGIVATLDNFGRTGAAPTHPELLDWLAVEFVRNGWSLKALHRLILNSGAYRQSSAVATEPLTLDPDNGLLSRFPLRRLEAEALRDTLLYVSGRLEERPFGPGDEVDEAADGLVTPRGTAAGWRRSIYVLQSRTQVPTMLEDFDLPRMSPNCISRSDSNVAPQALHLLNNRWVRELSDAYAATVIAEAGDDPAQRIARAYQRAYNRQPGDDEVRLAAEALAAFTDAWRDRLAAESFDPATLEAEAARRGLGNLCHALLNSAEFLYID